MKNNLEIYSTLNILCVEDDENILYVYKEMFSLIFKKVFFAKNGEEGYSVFVSEEIDIVLTDYNMPVMNGLEMSRKIRNDDATIPIVMVTALESLEMLKEAIDININGFIKKPLRSEKMFSTLEFVAKSVLANRVLLKEQSKKLAYNEFQESLTYQKEQTIIKNDFVQEKRVAHFRCDVFFRPKDVLSGDSYSLRKMKNGKVLCFIVDGMGKGISASVTAMMCCAYLNHLVDTQASDSLEGMLLELVDFIGKNLLEDEVVSATFLLFDTKNERLDYAMFSMPALVYTKKGKQEVFKLRSNNPPLASYTHKITVSTVETASMEKLLCFSDGLSENTLKGSQDIYAKRLPEDLRKVRSIQEFERLREASIAQQEDDITYMFFVANRSGDPLLEAYMRRYSEDRFLKSLKHYFKRAVAKREFDTSLEEVDGALEWYEEVCKELLHNDIKRLGKISTAFSELYMNAYEHGNLGFDAQTKQRYLQQDIYFDKLQDCQKRCDKRIAVSIYEYKSETARYIATQICDEGEGFDLADVERLYKDARQFNGRGIFISRRNTNGIYYNQKGNCVLFFTRCEGESDG